MTEPLRHAGFRHLWIWAACVSFLLVSPARSADRALLHSALVSVTASDAERHISALADDTFEGREAGSRGGRASGTYIARLLQQWGLAGGAADGGYFQPFSSGYRNVLAWIPGSDPKLSKEVVVVGAHYDHVGYGTRQNSYGPTGYIHNGADDNASGSAALLEIAEAFGRYELRPRRSILIAWWDAEEKGLLGSQHWVERPTVPLDQVRMAINLDMVGRLRDDSLEVSGTRTATGLRQLVARQNELSALRLDFTWEVADNSDHYSFYRRSVPFLMFHTGLHGDYHRPSDDVELVNFAGIERVTRLLLGTVVALAEDEQYGRFRRSARSENNGYRRQLERRLPPLPGRLGIQWNPQSDHSDGVRVTRVVTGSAADRAGIGVGDRLVSLAGQRIDSPERLRSLVLASPSDTTIEVVRPDSENPTRLDLELAGDPVRIGFAWRADPADPHSLILTRVVPGSPAGLAGLRELDRIYEFDGQRIVDSDSFLQSVLAATGGFDLLVERQGRLSRVRVELDESLAWAPANRDAQVTEEADSQ